MKLKICIGLLISVLVIGVSAMMAQSSIRVHIVDSVTNEAIAFVNIKFDDSQRGVFSDIDGVFEIASINCCEKLKLSYIGYKSKVVKTSKLNTSGAIIKMSKKEYKLDVVEILPEENPAFAIIRKVIDNRKINNPVKLDAFSYTAYHKFIVTIDREPIIEALNDTNRLDSSLISMNEFFSSHHLLIAESVSERNFKAPNNSKETVIATRFSGFSRPEFAILGSDLQSFSFYDPSINVLDKHYINPVNRSSLRKYFYLLEDSLFTNFDTTYIISFRPYKGTHFDGLKGQLHISSHKWALKNVTAEPASLSGDLGISFQQKYELINGEYWFPVQLNSDLKFYTLTIESSAAQGIARSYIRDIKINKTPEKKVRFNNEVLVIESDAGKSHKNEFWNKYRNHKLDSLETNTYTLIDSVGKAEHFDQKLKFFMAAISGRLPIGFVDLELNKLFAYNEFEGFRMGLGLRTNDRISRFVSLGAYVGWATRDYRWKYGGDIKFKIYPVKDIEMKISYINDIFESAKQYEFTQAGIMDYDSWRIFMIEEMVYHQTLKSELKFRALPHSSWDISANYSQIESPTDYKYAYSRGASLCGFGEHSKGDFNFFEVGLGWRFAFKECLYRTPNSVTSMGSKFPVLRLHYTKGLSGIYDSELNYQKIDFQLTYYYDINFLGKQSWQISAGKTLGNLPWYKLYNGKGSHYQWFTEVPFTFNTMRINEFLSDEYVALFFRHNFRGLLFGTKPYVPQPVFVTSAVIGNIKNSDYHENIKFNNLQKGYYESGILLNSIIKSGITNVGIGLFYRWGPYAFVHEKDNFSYKITIDYTI